MTKRIVKTETAAGGKVVCSGLLAARAIPDFIEGQLEAGRTNIHIGDSRGNYVCAW